MWDGRRPALPRPRPSLVSLTRPPSHTPLPTRQIPDEKFDKLLKTDSDLKDADRAVILECDDTECAQVRG